MGQRARELGRYALLAFVITWALVLPIGASTKGWVTVSVPGWWHTAGAVGPLLAAIIVARSSDRGTRDLREGWSRWRVSPWLYIAALSPLLFLVPAAGIVRVQEGAWPDVGLLLTSERLSGTRWLPAMVLPAIAYAVGEETGWRGFALPRLQGVFGPATATLVLAIIWIAWHAPFYLYRPGMAGSTPAEFVGQAIVIGLGAYFLTWLYNSTAGSIALVAIWHFSHSIVHIATPEVSVSWDMWNGVLSTMLSVTVMIVWRRRLSIHDTVST